MEKGNLIHFIQEIIRLTGLVPQGRRLLKYSLFNHKLPVLSYLLSTSLNDTLKPSYIRKDEWIMDRPLIDKSDHRQI